MNAPQIKICGLTDITEAVKCAELGADAIGLVFFPKSPRNVSPDQAGEISKALPGHVKRVGVFVNETYDTLMRTVERCRLDAVQLHGRETPDLIRRMCRENITVIKALFMSGSPALEEVTHYNASAYLVECGKGDLPGGNARTWDWAGAKAFGEKHPLILAGGLSPDNITDAVNAALPDAVDISSGVEADKGRKDTVKVEKFINTVKQLDIGKKIRVVF